MNDVALAPASGIRARHLPADLASLSAAPSWRSDLAWPFSPGRLRPIFDGQTRRFLELLRNLTDTNTRQIATLGGGTLLGLLRSLTEQALMAQARRDGYQWLGGPPALAYLRGLDAGASPPRLRPLRRTAPATHRWGSLRRLLRTASWTPWVRLPRALMAADGLVVTHNTLLVSELRRRRAAVPFHHAQNFFSALTSVTIASKTDHRALAEMFVTAVIGPSDLGLPTARRLQDIIAPHAAQAMQQAADDLATLENQRHIPDYLACGSAGLYATAALSLAVQRRGGVVERFDHGGSHGLSEINPVMAATELASASRFVAATPGIAQVLREGGAAAPLTGINTVDIVGGAGDPFFRSIPRHVRRQARSRPRVMYVPTNFRGLRQYAPPALADIIYLDWQMRFIESLKALPADLVVKPHPGGERLNDTWLRQIATVSDEPFEAVLGEADVVVFDYFATTTMSAALCSDCPVIYVDLDMTPVNPAIEAALAGRCRILRATYDEHNLPRIDNRELGDAVRDTSAPVDPSAFRALLAGD